MVRLILILLFLNSCASNELLRVNADINKELTYKTESGDIWQTPNETKLLKTGDCEDYAILKWSEFIKLGVDESELFFVYTEVKTGGYHLMLMHNDLYFDVATSRFYNDSDMIIIDVFNRFKPAKTKYINVKFNELLTKI